jgi:DNA helicase-2/ATP-dependent DNA helicase PcrA
VKEAKPFNPSPYQQAIFDFIQTSTGNAVVLAVAGAGKTTTIVQALRYTSAGDKVAFVAFNRHIARELQARAPEHVNVSTLHSLGFSNLKRHYKKVRVAGEGADRRGKLERLMDDMPRLAIPKDATPAEKSECRLKRSNFERLVALAKATLVKADDRMQVQAMIARYGLDLNGHEDELAQLLPTVLAECQASPTLVDFDDMLWLPVALGLPLEQFDWLFVDECQDLNACQIEFVLRSVKPGGRVVAVGDPQQSLYGFRGADTEAVQRLIKALHAQTLPLSITYRCPRAHVELARPIVPQLEAAANAIEGVIGNLTPEQFAQQVQPGDMVLCRTNAPLVAPAFNLIRQGVKAIVRGRDIGANLAALAKRFEGDTLAETEANLQDYYTTERRRLERRQASEAQVQALDDKVETLRAILEQCERPDQIAEKIELIFSDDNAGVVFSSVHRAKGLEAERVYILRPSLLPLKRKDMQPWELEQEHNCQYVAYTRSKRELYFITDDKPAPSSPTRAPAEAIGLAG